MKLPITLFACNFEPQIFALCSLKYTPIYISLFAAFNNIQAWFFVLYELKGNKKGTFDTLARASIAQKTKYTKPIPAT